MGGYNSFPPRQLNELCVQVICLPVFNTSERLSQWPHMIVECTLIIEGIGINYNNT